MHSFAYQVGYSLADYRFNPESFGYKPQTDIRRHFERYFGDHDALYDEFIEGFNTKYQELSCK